MFVKYLVRIIVRYIDNKKIDSLPDSWKLILLPVVTAAFEKKYGDLHIQVANILNNKIRSLRLQRSKSKNI